MGLKGGPGGPGGGSGGSRGGNSRGDLCVKGLHSYDIVAS